MSNTPGVHLALGVAYAKPNSPNLLKSGRNGRLSNFYCLDNYV